MMTTSMMTTAQLEHLQEETLQEPLGDEISAPAAKTFLGIAYMATTGKPTTSMINYFMRNNEKAFEDLLRHH